MSGPGGPCPCPGPWGQVLVLVLVLVGQVLVLVLVLEGQVLVNIPGANMLAFVCNRDIEKSVVCVRAYVCILLLVRVHTFECVSTRIRLRASLCETKDSCPFAE